jgi:hypothetical protein
MSKVRVVLARSGMLPSFMGGIVVALYKGHEIAYWITRGDGSAFPGMSAVIAVIGLVFSIASAYGVTHWAALPAEECCND